MGDAFLPLLCIGAFVVGFSLVTLLGPPLYARRRGFSWKRWSLGGGMFGLVMLSALPAANKLGLSPEEAEENRRKGNRIGLGFSVFTAALVVVGSIYAVANQAWINYQVGDGLKWSSQHHPVTVTYRPPWELAGEEYDRPDELKIAFRDRGDGRFCMLRIFPSKDVSSVEQLTKEVKYHLGRANRHNKLLDEGEVSLHGETYHRIRFRVRSPEWGDQGMNFYFREPDADVMFQAAFPWSEEASRSESALPSVIQDLDAGIKIRDEVQPEAAASDTAPTENGNGRAPAA